MKTRIFSCMILGSLFAGLLAVQLQAVELTGNLVTDGGMENWMTVKPTTPDWWQHLTRQPGCMYSYDAEKNIFMPTIFAQGAGMKVMQMENEDVHGGKHALRLKEGIYIRTPSKVLDGDIFVVSFWAKGTGMAQIYPTLYGDGRAEFLEVKGKPVPDRWTLIEERIQATGNRLDAIAFRLVATEALIDDVFIARVLRPDEIKFEEVPADCQGGIAFASDAGGEITLDGMLDEPAWSRAVAFSGFRIYGDQMLLSPVQPKFKVLFDRQNLYFGVEIPLPDASRVLEELKGNPLLDSKGQPRPMTDTFTGRESVELFLQAAGRSAYRQFVTSLDGYRYDGSGMDKEWNGTWDCTVRAADDRWFMEVRIPVKDLGIDQVEQAEGWRLNVCSNSQRGGSTWAAVGNNYHTPDLFGRLIVQDFDTWLKRQPEEAKQKKDRILQVAGANSSLYTTRLADIDAAAAPAGKNEQAQDWQTVTRIYSQMDYIGYAYRCVEEEVRYRGFFK